MALVDSWQFQKGLVDALRAKPTLTALLASLRPAASDTGIYDAVPEAAVKPYLVVGEGLEQQAAYFGQDARELLVDVEIWDADSETTTASSGAIGYRRPSSIKAIVEDVLLNDTITVSGGTAEVLNIEQVNRQRDDSQPPSTRVIIIRVRVLLEAS